MALTSEDVARRAGVSRSTVSYVLNGQGHRFSAATREAVQRAVDELGYVPQAAGRSLVRGQSDLVLATLPIAPNGSITASLARFTDRLAEHGLSLLLRVSGTSLESFGSAIRTLRPRALIALADLSDAERQILASANVLAVDIARDSSQPGGSQWRVGQLQAQHLVDRGYQRIAYARLAEARDDVMLQARELGVRDACRTAGLADPEVLTVTLRADADLDAIAALGPRTGVACYNDDTAAAALAAAHAIGRAVPDDLGLIGVDDSPVSTQTTPRLTTIGLQSDLDEQIVQFVLDSTGSDTPPLVPSPELELVPGGTT